MTAAKLQGHPRSHLSQYKVLDANTPNIGLTPHTEKKHKNQSLYISPASFLLNAAISSKKTPFAKIVIRMHKDG